MHGVGVAFVVFCCFEGGLVLFLMSGGIESKGVVWDLIVTRVAGNGLGPTGGEHVARVLMQLTGLQTLDLSGTC